VKELWQKQLCIQALSGSSTRMNSRRRRRRRLRLRLRLGI
jgi:hypothetical protein